MLFKIALFQLTSMNLVFKLTLRKKQYFYFFYFINLVFRYEWIQKLVSKLCPKPQPEGRVLAMEVDEM